MQSLIINLHKQRAVTSRTSSTIGIVAALKRLYLFLGWAQLFTNCFVRGLCSSWSCTKRWANCTGKLIIALSPYFNGCSSRFTACEPSNNSTFVTLLPILRLYDGFLGTNPTLVCGHPEAIKQVTIKNFNYFTNRRRPATWKSIRYRALTYMRDDEWKSLRNTLAPVFTGSKLKRMFELMKKCTRNVQNSIEAQSNKEIDLKQLFSVFTVDVISTCCFSMDLKDYLHPNSELLTSARKFFNVSRLKMAFYMAIPKQLLAISGFDINDTLSIDFFARFAQEIINKRRELAKKSVHFKKQDDFLQTLIDAAARFNERKADGTLNSSQRQVEFTDQPDVNDGDKRSSSTSVEEHQEQQEQQQQQRQVSSVWCLFFLCHTRRVLTSCARKTRASATGSSATVQANWLPQRANAHVKFSLMILMMDPNLLATTELIQSVLPPRIQINLSLAYQYTEQQLGDLEILAQSMLFFAVGHETTATVLSSCGYFLALYPELQDRLYAEVHDAFVEDKGEITYDRLLELKYLNAFVSEAMRYYTPTLVFDREASEDVELDVDGRKVMIPKGMAVVIPFHAVHHDPDNYDDPEKFDPERFMPENKHNIKSCTFIPFGCGPRSCLASRFAVIEIKLVLATLVNKFKFVKSRGTVWPPTFKHHYMLLQMEWPKIKFVDRKLLDNDMDVSQAQIAA